MRRPKSNAMGVLLLLTLTIPPKTFAQDPALIITPVSPVPLAPQLNRVRFIDARRAIAVGAYGTVLRTEDAGATWTRAESGAEASLQGVAVGGQTAIAVGERGTILRSTDAGATWARIAPVADVELRDIAIAANGWAIAVGAGGAVLTSRDGGATWSRQASPTTETLRGAVFVHDSVVVAVGDGGVIIASSNGGSSWITRSSTTSVQLRAVAFSDNAHGVAVGGDDRRWRSQNMILVTGDGGITWTRAVSPVKLRLYAVSAQGGAFSAVGEEGTLLRGEKFGASWKRDTTASGGWFGSVALADNVGLVTGAGGRILRSERGGSWKPVNAGPKQVSGQIQSIAHPSTNVVLVATGAQGPKARENIFRSVDGGATFTKSKSDSAGTVIFIGMRDSLMGIAVGQWGTVLRTVDAGATWKKVAIDSKRNLRMIAFADTATAVIVGAFARGSDSPGSEWAMFRTTDAGRSWSPVRTGSHAILGGVAFRGHKLGFAVGAAGTILRSRDGGATWTRIEQGITRTILRRIAILDDNNVIIAGEEGIVLRSTDAGSTWTKVETGVTTHFQDMRFTNDRYGVAVGFGDRAILTADGGLHWSPVRLGMPLVLNAVDVGTPTFVGGRGGMLRLDAPQQATPPAPGAASPRGGIRQ